MRTMRRYEDKIYSLHYKISHMYILSTYASINFNYFTAEKFKYRVTHENLTYFECVVLSR